MVKYVLTLLLGAAAFSANAAVNIGETAPNFDLPSHTGERVQLDDYADRTVVLEWTNYGCPFVRKHYDSNNMQHLQEEALNNDVVWLSIISSAEGKQGYLAPNEAQEGVEAQGFSGTAVLLDPEGTVGRTYGATNTPHMFIIEKGTVVYQGAIDDDTSWRPEGIAEAVNYVEQALAEVAAGDDVSTPKTAPYGCSVKYAN